MSQEKKIKKPKDEVTLTMSEVMAMVKTMQMESDERIEKMNAESNLKLEKQSLTLIQMISRKDKEILDLNKRIAGLEKKIDNYLVTNSKKDAEIMKNLERINAQDQKIAEKSAQIEALMEENEKLKSRLEILESIDNDSINIGCFDAMFSFFKPKVSKPEVSKNVIKKIPIEKTEERSAIEDTSDSEESISPKSLPDSDSDDNGFAPPPF